jgi:hypothetical protein
MELYDVILEIYFWKKYRAIPDYLTAAMKLWKGVAGTAYFLIESTQCLRYKRTA